MKIVQSFWSRPFMQSDSLLVDARFNGGWPHRTLNYYSWALSCLQLCKFHDKVELVTDELGKEILIDKMKLPYTNVVVALNTLDKYDPGLWTLGKIYTYGIQTEPFLHVDSDIFVDRRFDDDILEAPLAAQNLELRVAGYSKAFQEVCQTFPSIPDYFKDLIGREFMPSCNAGILGGNDYTFCQEYVKEVFAFLARNEAEIKEQVKVNAGNISIILEQVFFYVLAGIQDIPVTYLLPDADGIPNDIGYFHEAANHKDYVHCVSHYKRDSVSYSVMEWRLQQNYPEYYYRINQLIAESEI